MAVEAPYLPARAQRSQNKLPRGTTSLFLSLAICTLLVAGFWIGDAETYEHRFLLPVWICGVLIGIDGINWFRGRLDIFSPIGIIGLLGFHFFFIAPLLHLHWDFWMTNTIGPADWRDWMGQMAWLNVAGLLVYRFSRRIFAKPKPVTSQMMWKIHSRNFSMAVAYALVGTALLQLLIYVQFGGIMGYIMAYEDGGAAFEGKGWLFMLSEKFPVIALMGYAFYARSKDKSATWTTLLLLLVGYLILSLLFGGLRGSRSNTVWSLFWAVGIIHFWIRPLPKRIFYAGVMFLVMFMYVYGFFKGGGSEAFMSVIQGREDIELVEERTGRTMEGALLGDLGRTDIQAFVLWRMEISNYEPAKGRTYLGTAAILIPRGVWPDRPPNKVKEGTEIRMGMGTYIEGVMQSSRVHGLAGEAMLNFGPSAVPFFFVILGFVVGRTQRLLKSLHPDDMRWLMVPFLINLCFMVLIADSDNILFFFIKNGAVPFVVILMGSRRYRMSTSREGG
ncbi:MAG: hypothetical protein H0U74_08610 [Bradymonadaceae bacterium]|nr:hypothetical protein [Lujinxingiaceae bacterium]